MANDSASQMKEKIDFITKLNGYSSLSSAQTNNIHGISVNPNRSPAPSNKDNNGITFFTRPRLNLSYDNLTASRLMEPLTISDPRSMARAIRCMLDPVSEEPNRGVGINSIDQVKSEIFDPNQAFIPILTNNLLNISGWPDITLDTYTSKEGVYKESYSMVDGTSYLYGVTDITANFKNIQGDPITLLITAWCHYQALVYNGTMVPWPDSLLANEIDYNTRIYRLVMDSTFTYVQKIAATGAAFPTASPIGASFNFNSDSVFNRDNDQISVPFRCIGFNYMDPILVWEFNKTVGIFNKYMVDGIRDDQMRKISVLGTYEVAGAERPIGRLLQNILSNRMYPRINPATFELEWYATNGDYQQAVNVMTEYGVFNDVSGF